MAPHNLRFIQSRLDRKLRLPYIFIVAEFGCLIEASPASTPHKLTRPEEHVCRFAVGDSIPGYGLEARDAESQGSEQSHRHRTALV